MHPPKQMRKKITEQAQKIYNVLKVPAGPGSEVSVINQNFNVKYSRKIFLGPQQRLYAAKNDMALS